PLLSGRAPANERLRWRLSGRGAHPLASALARPGGGRKTADRLGGRPIPGAQTAAIAGPPVEWVSPQRAMITRKEIALPEAETLSGEIAPGGITSGEITAGASAPPAGLATEPGVTVAAHFLEAVTIIEAGPGPVAAAPDPTATVQEQLDDVDALVRRLERDPSDPVAGDLLEAIYARRGEREEIVALLLDRAEATEDPEARAGFLVRAARLYRADLGDLSAAGMVLVTALRAVPGDRRVHEELDALVCATGEFAAARAAYADAAVALAPRDPALAGELWLRVASL